MSGVRKTNAGNPDDWLAFAADDLAAVRLLMARELHGKPLSWLRPGRTGLGGFRANVRGRGSVYRPASQAHELNFLISAENNLALLRRVARVSCQIERE